MDAEWIIRIVLFGLVHWVLAGILLADLAERKKGFGGRKTPCALVIIFLPNLSSILYLLFHSQGLYPNR